METRANHVLIGLFTVLMFSATFLFALWLSKSSTDSEFKDYEVIFNEAVSGLSQGSTVQYSGIKVGDVTRLGLDPKDPRKVHVIIRILRDTPIKQDTSARLSITGITGASVIQLHGGTPDSPPLVGKGMLPIIVADPSPLSKLMASGEDVMVNVTRLLDRANQLLTEDNIKRVSLTLAHLEQITASAAAQRDELGQVVQQLKTFASEAATLMSNTNNLLNGQGRQTLGSIERLTTSLERSSQSVERLLEDNHAELDKGLKSVGDLRPVIDELRETLAALRSLSRRLEEDPAGYLLHSDTTKEFQP
ncbi:MAG: MlaD family protein [Georgfuchsia sp.]